MGNDSTLVLDIGKTNSKMSLWDSTGRCLARRVRANPPAAAGPYPALDLAGLESWVAENVAKLAALTIITAIVPVTHGAAAVLVADGQVFVPPMDYEAPIPADFRAAYDAARDPFGATGSPALPNGLNLGAQLAWLEANTPPWPENLRILPWPQYWAWRFCGEMASELTSLGCHTDLWRPLENRPSHLAQERGWATRLPPLRAAGDTLGTVTAEWRAAGLPRHCRVLTGIHDSNAALLAARAHPELAQADATILSTGTWFVAMRSLAPGATTADIPPLRENRDCLLNVDAAGRPAPSARFMAGREAELIAGLDPFHPADKDNPAALIAAGQAIAASDSMVLPSFTPGVGPFPHHQGQWRHAPTDPTERRAALSLYLALMTDICLDMIGTGSLILIEGRFAEAEFFTRALATLRPTARVYVSNAQDDVPFGARRLADPTLPPPGALRQVAPLPALLDAYRARWRHEVQGAAP